MVEASCFTIAVYGMPLENAEALRRLLQAELPDSAPRLNLMPLSDEIEAAKSEIEGVDEIDALFFIACCRVDNLNELRLCVIHLAAHFSSLGSFPHALLSPVLGDLQQQLEARGFEVSIVRDFPEVAQAIRKEHCKSRQVNSGHASLPRSHATLRSVSVRSVFV